MSTIISRQPGDIVNQIYSEYITPLVQMCTEAGDDPNVIIAEIKDELRKMVADMMAEDEALLARKRTEIALIRAHFQSLYHELHPDQTCPVYENSLPILLAVRAYHDELKRLQAEHEQLLVQEGDIRKEERSLCNELNACSLQVDHEYFASKPLITQISLLSDHIQELKEEKAKRIAHLSQILRILNDFEDVYGWTRPKVETMVGRLLNLGLANLTQFPLTKEAIDLVDRELTEITEQIQKAEATFEESNKQLSTLMRAHQSIVPNPKVLAISNGKQCRLSKLPDLIAEVDRYKEHAIEKLTNDILKARERIYAMLTKLAVNDATENTKYTVLYATDFTEDIYFMHEELLQELEAQYEVNKSMYEQIELWNELFLEYQEFEKNASDPQRFHRRGYSALLEEKTRRKLESALRECENRLQHLSEDYMKRNNGQTFVMTANGKEISDYIQQRKDDYSKSKEREREASKTPASKKKARTETVVRARPAPLQSVPGSDENNNYSEDNQCATTLCVPASRKKKYFF